MIRLLQRSSALVKTGIGETVHLIMNYSAFRVREKATYILVSGVFMIAESSDSDLARSSTPKFALFNPSWETAFFYRV